MDQTSRQYEIPPPQTTLSWKHKLVVFCCMTVFVFGFLWVFESLLHSSHRPLALDLSMAALLAGNFIFRPFRKRLYRGGSLVVGEDFVEGRTNMRWFTYKKRIRRDEIKSISENKRGLSIMDRGEFAARMLGFVFIPATIPEYQEIKAILAQWTPPALS